VVRVLVTGSRDWDDRLTIYRGLHEYVQSRWPMGYDSENQPVDWVAPCDFVLVHGACPTGADSIADDWAINNWLIPERHPADWEKYGKRAGFIRNSEMVDAGADLLLAFIKNESKGATMTLRLAEKAGIPCQVWRA